MAFYNFSSAFFICGVAYIIGEYVSNITKAWIPSVFVTACVMLIGYWTIFPKNLVTDASLMPLGNTIALFFIIVNIGTIISMRQLLDQWKVVIICLFGLFGMCLVGYFGCSLFMDRSLIIAGLPSLTGGIVAASIMQTAATKAGLIMASVFAITMYCVQGFAGYPLTAVCLQKEGKKLLKELRSGAVQLTPEQIEANNKVGLMAVADESDKKTLLPKVPEEYNTAVFMLTKIAFVAWCSMMLGQITPINGAIWALILGIGATYIGFLDQNTLTRANSNWLIMFALSMFIFDGLKNCTPDMLISIIQPMILLVVIGTAGMGIFAFIIAKIFHTSFPLSFAYTLNALYGFPFNAIITEMTCNSLSKNEVERGYLMSKMFPGMIVGGFTTVTLASVFIAGWFSNLL